MQVTRQQVATAAVRAVAIWMIVQGVAAGIGSLLFLSRARSLGASEQPSAQLLVMVAVIPLIAGMILWASARWIATLVFRERTSETISGHSSTRMLERYTHPTLERRIAALETFNLSTKCPQTSVQQKEAAEAASFAKHFGLPAGAPEVSRGGPPSPKATAGNLRVRSGAKVGGRQEARTPDLRVANAALSQLS